MNPERLQQIQDLYHAARNRAADDRPGFLAESSGGDNDLRREVESLLAQDGGVMERPAMEVAAELLAAGPAGTPAKIGPYEIQAPLGAGGIGHVYRALDLKLKRPVAVKLLSDQWADASARRRFQREVQTASSLNHPHILTVYDAGEVEGRQYLVTELVEGGTLRDWSQAARRNWREIVELLTGIADGLATAHEARILHRDIKPGNILISKSGYAKLADFGLAKSVEKLPSESNPTNTLGADTTRAGMVIGTIAYMSPEQASGRPLDARSDIFSFGVVLYEVLAGRRPFTGGTDLEVLQTIIHGKPQPLGEEVPPALRAVVEKALEREPAERYQTMREVVVDLRRAARRADELTSAASALHAPRWKWVAAAVIVLAALGGIWKYRVAARPPEIRSIAVLPLDNFSGDPAQEYFSDGTTEALISKLAQIHSLNVISRTSVMRYKRTTKPLSEIGRELGADALIEGSVQRIGNRVRITAQLIRASTDTHLWARDYEQDAGDMLRLESDVAQAIAIEIRAQVTPEESARVALSKSIDPAAHDEYLLASYESWKYNIPDLKQSVRHFERAIQLQPDYAAAYAGVSSAWQWLGQLGEQPAAAFAAARTAAAKALKLDPDLAEAHAALALIYFTDDWDWENAEREARRALELNPNSIDRCACYEDILFAMGRFAEAVDLAKQAVKADPLSARVHERYATMLAGARRYEEAVPEYLRALELAPGDSLAHNLLSATYIKLGRFQDALAVVDVPQFKDSAELALAYAAAGRRAEALKIATSLSRPGAKVVPSQLATVYFALGDKDRGFEWLSKSLDTRDALAPYIKFSFSYDDARADPRFQRIVSRLNLPDAPR